MILSGVDPSDTAEIGGKAAVLARLTQAGFPVPPAFVVPVSVFRDVAAAAGLDLTRRDLADALRTVPLPRDLAHGWIEDARRLGSRLAVRSSGVDEDGATRSFAGQHRSVLGATPEEVPDAVRACWASAWEARALAYRGEGPGPTGIAVLVQALVEPAVSGVLFTVNPMTGSWREMVVEAVFGLGEGVVSGHTTPHWFLVRRPPALPGPVRRWAERVRLRIVREDLPDQTEEHRLMGGVVRRVARPPETQGRRTLDRPALRRLCRLALDVEHTLGAPQDIEWARAADGAFVVLQARPITTKAPRARREIVWTRRFVGERWPDPVTPLGWSLIEPVLTWFIGWRDTQERLLGGGPPLALFHGRPYVNATVFRHLAFKLPGARPPAFMVELVPPDEEDAWRSSFAVAPDLSVYASLLTTAFRERRWRRFALNPLTNHLVWDRFRDRLEAEMPALGRPPAHPVAAVRSVETHLDLVRDYVAIHVCSLLFANVAWQLLDGALSSWLPERTDLLDALAASPSGNLTVETNAALHTLAATAKDADLAALARGEPPPTGAFAAALATFLARYGHRSEASWEILAPRWRHHPERLVPLLRAQRDAAGDPPAVRAEQREERFRRALRDVRSSLSRGPKRASVELMVRTARRYLLLRENQRFWLDRLLASLQDQLLWLGTWAAGAGHLDARDDVAFVTWPELQALATGTARHDLNEHVAQRKAQRAVDLATPAPTFLRGDAPLAPPEGARRLQGTGISPGRARGRVRVLEDVSSGHLLRPGEVLVTHAVDPGVDSLVSGRRGHRARDGQHVVARRRRRPRVRCACRRQRRGGHPPPRGRRGGHRGRRPRRRLGARSRWSVSSLVSRGRQVIAIGVGVAVVAWVSATALLYTVQDAIVFPVPGGIGRDALDAAAAEVGARPMDLVASDGVRSYTWLRSVGADRLVIYFPGNAETVADNLGLQRLLLGAQFDVLVVAGRGYPGSEGHASEAGFALDARAAWAWATGPGGFPPDRIVLHGRSLGGGVAAELAEAENPCGLVLESTFSSLVDLAAARYPIFPVRSLLRHRFETDERAPRLGVPTLVLHSTADRTVPIAWSAVKLAPLLAEGEVHVVDGFPHADSLPVVDAGIRAAWLAFLDRVAPRR